MLLEILVKGVQSRLSLFELFVTRWLVEPLYRLKRVLKLLDGLDDAGIKFRNDKRPLLV
jgi:hypothetical protein